MIRTWLTRLKILKPSDELLLVNVFKARLLTKHELCRLHFILQCQLVQFPHCISLYMIWSLLIMNANIILRSCFSKTLVLIIIIQLSICCKRHQTVQAVCETSQKRSLLPSTTTFPGSFICVTVGCFRSGFRRLCSPILTISTKATQFRRRRGWKRYEHTSPTCQILIIHRHLDFIQTLISR